ncbi:DUF1381 domain-containing protein [Staphylococcus saprophyticus]|uniref:DUF1381 domain-containing protein n=1 Tax=Staphylococcus saprophyticus TaxID=29385 RepID=UPI002DC6F43B|nr:DUF1381 domain-containing protein [Staphylococcus saprophyticus]
MTQYLIRTLTDSTGHPFTHVTKARDNETLTVVKAESKEEAEKMAKKPKGLLSYVPSSFNNGLISRALSKTYRKSESGRCSPKPEIAPIPPRKDSE